MRSRILIACSAMTVGALLASAPAPAQFVCDSAAAGEGGDAATATGIDAVACGSNADATGAESTAVGDQADAIGSHSVALGSSADIDVSAAIGSVAVGASSLVLTEANQGFTPVPVGAFTLGSVAVGGFTNINGSFNVAIGVGATIGTDPNDSDIQANGSIALGADTVVTGNDSIAIGAEQTVGFNDAISIGRNTIQSTFATAIGQSQTANGDGSVALGHSNSSIGIGTVAIGRSNSAGGSGALAIGDDNGATGDGAVAIGAGSDATGDSTVAIGANANALAEQAIAIGEDTFAGNSSVVVGANASATGTGSVALGSGSVASGDNVVSVGSALNQRRITNVAAGTGATDAVNVSQLNAAMAGIATSIAGLTTSITALESDVGLLAADNRRQDKAIGKANEGVAMALALDSPTLREGSRFALSGGIGGYRGKHSLATAISAAVGDKASVSAGLGYGLNSGEIGYRAGFQIEW